MSNKLEPVYDGLEELSELGGILLREIFEEPGAGQGVPGKVGKNLIMHPSSFDLGSDCCEPASTECFGTVKEVAGRLCREPRPIMMESLLES